MSRPIKFEITGSSRNCSYRMVAIKSHHVPACEFGEIPDASGPCPAVYLEIVNQAANDPNMLVRGFMHKSAGKR